MVIDNEKVKEDIINEISILNSNLQISYENYKKKNISKDEYLKKSLSKIKRYYWRVSWKELKSED